MTNTAEEFEIVEAQWPEREPASKKVIRDFLASGLPTAEIKGPNKEFLVNVRRTAKTQDEFKNVVELRMVDGRMFIRRVAQNNAQTA